jgi:phosphohistidine phosphatase
VTSDGRDGNRGPDRTLHLLRHAKSSWDDPALRDDERPLAPRGRRAAAALRGWLDGARTPGDRRSRIDLVLVSPAVRARQTWEAVAPALDVGEVRTDATIYEASAQTLLTLVRSTPSAHRSLLLVGHNPGLHELATWLSGDGNHGLLDALHEKFPTGAFASLSFASSWTHVRRGSGLLTAFVRARDLIG